MRAAVLVVAMSMALLAGCTSGSGGSVATTSTPPVAQVSFQVRPVLCFAPPYAGSRGKYASTTRLPGCAAAFVLNPANLAIVPDPNSVQGFASNPVPSDPRFASVRTTTGTRAATAARVLLASSPMSGATERYVLGPVGLSRSSVASASPAMSGNQWVVDLTLTSAGSKRWDELSRRYFHHYLAVVADGLVISAPLVQPTQTSWASFGGMVQIGGAFTKHEAETLAAGWSTGGGSGSARQP